MLRYLACTTSTARIRPPRTPRADGRRDIRESVGPTSLDRRHSANLKAHGNRPEGRLWPPSSSFIPVRSERHRTAPGVAANRPPGAGTRRPTGANPRAKAASPSRTPAPAAHLRSDTQSGRRSSPPGPVHRLRGMRRQFPPARRVQCGGPTHAAPMQTLPYGPGQSARPGARPHTRSTPGHLERGPPKGRPDLANRGPAAPPGAPVRAGQRPGRGGHTAPPPATPPLPRTAPTPPARAPSRAPRKTHPGLVPVDHTPPPPSPRFLSTSPPPPPATAAPTAPRAFGLPAVLRRGGRTGNNPAIRTPAP